MVANDVYVGFVKFLPNGHGLEQSGAERTAGTVLARLSGWSGESKGSERESEDGFDKHRCVCSELEQ
jgi:hypothetical protein